MPQKEELESLRHSLEEQLAQLREQMRGERATRDTERANHTSHEVMDCAEEAADAEQAATEEALSAMQLRQELYLQAALHRVAANSFGRCIDCDDDIDPARLRAYPTCRRCQSCQAAHERTGVGKPLAR